MKNGIWIFNFSVFGVVRKNEMISRIGLMAISFPCIPWSTRTIRVYCLNTRLFPNHDERAKRSCPLFVNCNGIHYVLFMCVKLLLWEKWCPMKNVPKSELFLYSLEKHFYRLEVIWEHKWGCVICLRASRFLYFLTKSQSLCFKC